MVRPLPTLIAAAALVGTAPAQAAVPPPCLTPPEAESIVAVALPDVLAETGRVCAGRLAPASPLARANGPFLHKFALEADRAWPAAREAIGKLSLDLAAPLLQSEYARPLFTSLLTPLLVGRIAVKDCGTIDRFVTELAPLPARNVAQVVVTMLGYLRDEKAHGKNVDLPDLPLCPATVTP